MQKKSIGFLIIALVGVVIAIGVYFVSPWGMSLNKVHAGIETMYQNVEHIDAATLSEMDDSNLVIFDVRELEEFEVSHIQGAIQLNPNFRPEDFDNAFSDLIEDKVVVFYCSVGMRSSAQASALENILVDANATDFYNLKGGVFQWRNELRPLVKDKETSTKNIHPYNDYWGELIEDELSISYL